MTKRPGPGPSLILVGSTWHYRFQRAGKRIQRSTGETDRVRAEVKAWAAWDGRAPLPTLSQLAQSWLEIHELVVSKAHYRSVREFEKRQHHGLGELRIDRIRTEDVEGARNAHLAAGFTRESTNLWLRILLLLYGWAVRKRKMLPGIPWKVSMLRRQKEPRFTLSTSKTTAWLEALDAAAGDRWGLAAAVRLMLGVGLREDEALNARWEWVDWDRNQYTPGETKGREAVPLPMPAWLLDHLKKRRRIEGLVVRSPRGGAYSAGATRTLIARANKAAGVVGLTPHRLRGTFATLLSEEGMPVQGIQKLMRHKDSRTTMGYLEVDLERAVEVQERIAKRMGMWRKKGEPGNVRTQGAQEKGY